jgi:hypothetical protein
MEFVNRESKSPCWNDKCILITNYEMFPNPSLIKLQNFNMKEIENGMLKLTI